MRRVLIDTILVVSAVCFQACGSSYEQKQQLNRAQQKDLARKDSAALKIATVPTMDCLPLFIGTEDSLFQKAGVDVHLRARTSQLDGDTLIAGGHVEAFVTDLIRAERLQKQGVKLRYIASTNAYWQLISNRLVRVKEIKQLSDKMIAMTRFSVTDYLSDLAVDSAKPQNEVYRVQINDVQVRLKMLLNNEMDAELLTEPQATTARINHHLVLMDSRHRGHRFGVIAMREKALKDKSRQQQLHTFIKVYNDICDSINKKGIQHYAPIIKKYMGADDRTVKALPKLKYAHAAAPASNDIAVARQYWK